MLVFTLLSSAASPEENTSPFSVGGLAFGDLYYLASHHLPDTDGVAAAVLRRGYLTANADFDNGWFGRVRVEINQDGEFETYDFEADFKDAYVGYKFEDHQLMMGLQPTLTFDVIESVWGLRYLMRTPADLQGVPSRDTGFSLKGKLGDAWSYRLMLGIGEDYGAESGDGESTMGALNWQLTDHWMLDFYVDHEARPGPNDTTSAQIFAGYETDDLRLGAQYSYRDREANPHADLASAFVVKRFGQKLSGIGRIDWVLEPSIRGNNIAYIPFDPSAKATMYLGGLEYQVSDHFYVTPNTILISYGRNDDGIRPETDLYLRLTLFLDFE